MNRTDRTLFVWRLNPARSSNPGHSTILLRSEISSGMHATIEIMRRNLYYYCLLAPSIYIFVLRAHTIRGESHNQCNATGKVATRRSEARGVPGGGTAPQNFAWPPQWPSQMKISGSDPAYSKVLHRPLTAPFVAKLAPPVASPNKNVWLRPWQHGRIFGYFWIGCRFHFNRIRFI